MSKLEKLRELVLQRLSGYQCMAEMPYSFDRLMEIEDKLLELRWVFNRIDELLQEEEPE